MESRSPFTRALLRAFRRLLTWALRTRSPLAQAVLCAAGQLLALAWIGHVLLGMTMIVFRGVKTSGIANAIQFDDIPLLRHFDTNYLEIYPWLVTSGIAMLAVFTAIVWKRLRLGSPFRKDWFPALSGEQRTAVGCLFLFFLFEVCMLRASQPFHDPGAALAPVESITLLDWTAVLSLGVMACVLPSVLSSLVRGLGTRTKYLPELPTTSRTIRNAGAYLICCGLALLYALKDHATFWNQEANGGYDYKQFFIGKELQQAQLVLLSTSVLFASLAAVGGCVLIALFRRAAENSGNAESNAGNGTAITLLSAMSWSLMLHVAWQIKIWPEIEAERGWILPACTIVFTAAALVPALQLSWLRLTEDFRRFARRRSESPGSAVRMLTHEFHPRYSELALWNFVLFPLYPLISPLANLEAARSTDLENSEKTARAAIRQPAPDDVFAWYGVLLGVCLIAVVGFSWAVYRADDWYKFDDWRGMLKSGLFPFLRIAVALLGGCLVYVVARRLLVILHWPVRNLLRRDKGDVPRANWFVLVARPVVLGLAIANLVLATWPFWGWQNVRKNVFARTAEFNRRHDFELRFLHWLFDFDRDGYSALLHGADPDDFDADVQPGNLEPPRDDNVIPIDEFQVSEKEKAKKLPNIMLLFLEGVVPRAISAYGNRWVKGTPNIDAVAEEGVVFTEARCFYPSTWDAWMSTMSGRFLRIQEMDNSRGFGNRYSRYGNMYKVMQLAGIDRYCHADTSPFFEMTVPTNLRKSWKTAWKTNYDSSVGAEEEARGVWRGDKRNQRIMEFLDTIQPGERFFVSEHMSDTHFPWRTTPGLEWSDDDAVLPGGTTDATYSRYFQSITRMDQQVGQLIEKLKQRKLYDNTIIIIVSDHGCQWWEHEHMYYVGHLYEPAIRIPMIVRIPGLTIPDSARVVHEPVMQVDLLPTIMELAGVVQSNPRADHPFTGRSLLPLMTGTATKEQREKYRNRDMPLTTHYDKHGVLVASRYKLIFNRPVGTYKLFDLQDDPKELKNLADERPELLKQMLAKLRFQLQRHPTIIGGIKRDDADGG